MGRWGVFINEVEVRDTRKDSKEKRDSVERIATHNILFRPEN